VSPRHQMISLDSEPFPYAFNSPRVKRGDLTRDFPTLFPASFFLPTIPPPPTALLHCSGPKGLSPRTYLFVALGSDPPALHGKPQNSRRAQLCFICSWFFKQQSCGLFSLSLNSLSRATWDPHQSRSSESPTFLPQTITGPSVLYLLRCGNTGNNEIPEAE